MNLVYGNETLSSSSEDSSRVPLTVESIDNHIYFYSNINSDKCLDLIKRIKELDTTLITELETRSIPVDFPFTPIWLHINSSGGRLLDAFAVVDQIKQTKTPIYSIVEGYVASAATVISMGCSKRFIQPTAFMMIHQLSSVAWGKYEEMKDGMNLLDMAMDALYNFYVDYSKIKKKEIKQLLQHDSWFNANHCIEKGLVDKIQGE